MPEELGDTEGRPVIRYRYVCPCEGREPGCKCSFTVLQVEPELHCGESVWVREDLVLVSPEIIATLKASDEAERLWTASEATG